MFGLHCANMRAWLWLSLMLALPHTVAADAPPESSPGDGMVETTARVEALVRAAPRDDAVKRPLAIAQRALEKVREARARGARDDAARAEQLALAAIELAETRLRLGRERALREATARRREEAEHALARARAEASPAP